MQIVHWNSTQHGVRSSDHRPRDHRRWAVVRRSFCLGKNSFWPPITGVFWWNNLVVGRPFLWFLDIKYTLYYTVEKYNLVFKTNIGNLTERNLIWISKQIITYSNSVPERRQMSNQQLPEERWKTKKSNMEDVCQPCQPCQPCQHHEGCQDSCKDEDWSKSTTLRSLKKMGTV